MIRIAVCDDEPAFAERVKTLIEEECRALSVSSEMVLYTDSGMLAYDIGEKRYFDMLSSISRCLVYPAWSWRI